MKRIVTVIFLTALYIIEAFAQNPHQEGRMSMKDCMLYALEHSPRAKIQQSSNDDRRIDNRAATLNLIPSVSGGTSAYSNFGRSIDPETNIYTNVGSFNNSYSIDAEYTIFNGFSAVNNLKISKIAILSGIEEYQQVKDDICLQVIQAYYNVIYLTEMVKITKEQYEESQRSLRQTKIMEELGTKGQADVLQIEAEVATKDYNRTKEENNLAQAILTLKSIMSYPANQTLQIDTNITIMANPFLEKESPDSIFRSAIEFLPELKLAQYEINKAELNYKSAKWKLLPYIYARGSISTGYMTSMGTGLASAPFTDQIKGKLGEQIGIGMSIPIFSSLNRWNNKAKMKNEMLRAEFRKEQKLQEVETEIQRACQEMEGAAKQYFQSEKRASAQEMAHKANSRKYEEGLISVLDLQTSSNLLLVSKAERLNNAFTYLIKSKVVEYYKGTSYLDQE